MTDDDEQARNEADQRTLIALSLLLLTSLLLLGLMAVVLPGLLAVVLVVGALIVFCSGHYIVWGWWLPRFLKRLEANEAEREARAKEVRGDFEE